MTDLEEIIKLSDEITAKSDQLVAKIGNLSEIAANGGGVNLFVFGLFIFILACFIGYFVVWKVTPALHTPLMAVTNAISGVIIIGGIISLGSSQGFGMVSIMSFLAIIMASINIFGGFYITHRMLNMFKK